MISLLAKIFIKGNSKDSRKAYGKLCSIVGIFLNVCLFAGKYFAGVITGSIAVTADAFNNLSDAGSSFITLVGFSLAGKKPDTDHPYGHGRMEYISGFVVAIAIILMGFELGKSSIAKILKPEVIDTGALAMVILVASILVKLYMFSYNYAVGKKIDSAAMKATATDSLSDSVATFVVLLSVLAARFFDINIDGWCGTAVAAFILFAGYNAAKDTLDPLLGKLPEPEFVKDIEETVMKHSMVTGIHDLVVHDYGPGRVMISLHAEVPGNLDIFDIHEEIDNIELELKDKFGCDAVIHMDPVETDNELLTALKAKISDLVVSMYEGAMIHDFRMVQGKGHTNIIFDVVIPFSCKDTTKEITQKILQAVKSINKTYELVLQIDRPYV